MKLRAVALLATSISATACGMFGGGGSNQPAAPAPAPAPAGGPPAPGVVAPMSPADYRGRPAADAAAAAGPSLYTRLGGQPALTAVVDDFVGRVAADERINAFFRGVDIPNFKRLLTEQICQATGGPCAYTGRSMRVVHTGMGLTDDHFNALVGDLVAALDHFNVPAREKNELLGALGGMRPDIVGH